MPRKPLMLRIRSATIGLLLLQAEGDFQSVPIHQAAIGEDHGGRAVGADFSFVEHDHPRAQLGYEIEIVRGDKLGTVEPL
jgi:hypothetical protein